MNGFDRAGYIYITVEETICTDDPSQNPGSGGTTPTPPGEFDPCPDEPIENTVQSLKKLKGNKVMVVALTECDSIPVDCAGVRGGTAYMADCGCIGGTTGISECPPKKEITNKVKNPCIKDQVNQAINAKSAIGELLRSAFGGNDPWEDFNLEIKDTTNLPSNVDGEMERLSGLNYEIRLNQNILPNYSKEYIFSTIYHEVLHAYFTQKYAKDQNGIYLLADSAQHNRMADDYIIMMSEAIHNAYGLIESECWALAWEGLHKTNYYTTKLTDQQRAQIQAINNKHRNKLGQPSEKSGTYCN